MNDIRIVLVDDHAIVRMGLKALIAAETGLVIVGESGTEEGATALIASTKPDVVITDIRLGRGSGIEVCRATKRLSAATKVLLISAYWDDRLVGDALSAGADGYLLKQAELLDVGSAVAAAVAGRPAIAHELLPILLRLGRENTAIETPLTERERGLIALIARGYTNQMIASEMHLSAHTVKEYVSRVLEKLGASNRTELTSIAAARGLITAA